MKWSTIEITIRPFWWKLMPYYERCVVDSTVRWLCLQVRWENP